MHARKDFINAREVVSVRLHSARKSKPFICAATQIENKEEEREKMKFH